MNRIFIAARSTLARGALNKAPHVSSKIPAMVAVMTQPRLIPPAIKYPVRYFAADAFLDKGEVTERILAVVKNFEKVEPGKVTPTSHFKEDLGLDSLDAVEVVMAVEEEFAIEIPDAEADKILSVEDAINFIASHPMAK
mmetsp:Transcript_27653/g.36284  ORF Transcript_27653/g.36284 Transcript_27653/m.36284 type:complete len:139 (+) Transcript_27653:56-472(+)|eukprot:CAMPEP_0117757488 /NCGR_PEP_ID=MMETSP0947-20121206/14769_1 /TAXON_ID=44440 /ORGANISM="Chattonella subsalsa, Strain CCMP2191" /LENGTH=138 /DNA_ID=CAMNT_0005577407 /DNA_START=56 /DNA_END=472 /DNA_ORIENTATION=+